jgi:hypothetical protein
MKTDTQTLIEHDQAETTRAINLRQHLDGALAEIQHLRRTIYDLTDSRAKFARKSAHADKLAEALRGLFTHCAMVHKYWGENCNQAEADAAIANATKAQHEYELAQ